MKKNQDHVVRTTSSNRNTESLAYADASIKPLAADSYEQNVDIEGGTEINEKLKESGTHSSALQTKPAVLTVYPKEESDASSSDTYQSDKISSHQETLLASASHKDKDTMHEDKERIMETRPASGRRRRQAQLNFSVKKGTGPLSLKLDLTEVNDVKQDGATQTSAREPTDLVDESEERLSNFTPTTSKLFVKIPLKLLSNSTGGNGVVVMKSDASDTQSHGSVSEVQTSMKSKKITLKTRPRVSRTTIIHEKSKILRSNPGPLVSLNYDLYDDNLINASLNRDAALEELAFGFPVKHKPYALDITYIITFLSMFEELILIGPLGPADFEKGLGLENVSEEESENSIHEVSSTMDLLFRRLLALVLNRKKPIASDGQRSALQELKSKYISFGLPLEWRDDSKIHKTTKISSGTLDDGPGDPSLQNSENETAEFEGPLEFVNPFHEASFEKDGFKGIQSADDRCIMMRCMVTWCLSESTAVKQFFASAFGQQDTSGERDTLYGSRAILKGFTHAHESKKDLERKYSRKGKPKQSPETTNFPKYFDPTSDPLNHPLNYRLNEFVVGDCGFHIGRFYLVRMADHASGRTSSMEQMRSLAKDLAGVRMSSPSGFALYVEDVHALLTETLEEFGVEFDEDGNEVQNKRTVDESQHWYCVASTCDELENFLAHLGSKLGISEGSQKSMSQSSVIYHPALHMYLFLTLLLPMMFAYEKLKTESVVKSRASRRKRVEYATQAVPDDDNEEYLGGEDDDYSEEEQDEEYMD
ncbi:hypothetical protein METBIDRAFT_13088 [Metschnikowia bicuspidata var. bicuspidata NRRL YB-4993]|uniref:WHIM1 domain-containing protein n=1 Tax=Metschnikowia bicuspidata var. bicuspidata NRRL YB-4993 TaxID=869754 RepID=A0A1A0H848_9ASCO|nr:hypothetical protein METBIDRAFT_13088 [Metschnikowia bicuspidata var. bicuspidata NRRL YB-4993]OBA20067.1 hypothetical protein METBIDRAFT_13088 [Metschnikowia bicuspidata var. bicuspidata NRRL YB-4993]